jgi:hypothetical protein
MCNLYSLTKGQAAIVALVRAMRDRTGNLPPMPGIFPDYLAPIARNAPDGVRELATARWGMPGPPAFGGAPITNIRNVKGPHWRAWLKPEHRCALPFTSFCEYADTKPRKTPTWFALSEDRPLAVFAGIWTIWHGKRGTKANPVEGQHERRSRRDSSQGDAGHSHDRSRDRAMDNGAGGGGTEASAPATGRSAQNRHDGGEGRPGTVREDERVRVRNRFPQSPH